MTKSKLTCKTEGCNSLVYRDFQRCEPCIDRIIKEYYLEEERKEAERKKKIDWGEVKKVEDTTEQQELM